MMKTSIRVLMASTVIALAFGCAGTDLGKVGSGLLKGQGGLDTKTITAGLKEALQVGVQRAVDQASAEGGYAENQQIHISLPDKLDSMANTLRRVGLGGQVNTLEKKMNLAAEEAASKATPVFVDAIKGMSFADAREILNGGDTAATDYLRGTTLDELTKLYTPTVNKHLQSVGVVDLYNQLHERYKALPLAPSLDFKPTDYVTGEALDGLFALLAQEEQKIRADPAARTTDLLKQVFAAESK